MYANMTDEVNFENINEIYSNVKGIFNKFKSLKNLSIDELVDIYSNDSKFLNELKIIEDSLEEINNILAPFEDLENEYCFFFNIQRMIKYIIKDVKLFLVHISFIDDLLINFFNLIHHKLGDNDDKYQIHYRKFLSFLDKQKDFFYTQIYEYSEEYEDVIIKINNILWR